MLRDGCVPHLILLCPFTQTNALLALAQPKYGVDQKVKCKIVFCSECNCLPRHFLRMLRDGCVPHLILLCPFTQTNALLALAQPKYGVDQKVKCKIAAQCDLLRV